MIVVWNVDDLKIYHKNGYTVEALIIKLSKAIRKISRADNPPRKSA